MTTIKQVIVVRRDLNMRKGKMCSQVAHASMMFLSKNNRSDSPMELCVSLTEQEAEWLRGLFTKIVVGVNSEKDLLDLVDKANQNDVEVHCCYDAGLTEFHGIRTLTCAAFGPDDDNVLDEITGHLKLL